MKRSIGYFVLIASVVVGLVRCGGGSSKLKTPNSSSFTSPTGTLTNDNATEAMNNALDAGGAASNISGFSGAKLSARVNKALSATRLSVRMREQGAATDITSCITGNDTSGKFDLGCLSDQGAFSPCTASGTVEFSGNDTEFTIKINNIKQDCPTDSDDFGPCNGKIASNANLVTSSSSSEPIVCTDVTCTTPDGDQTFDECTFGSQVLVDAGDGTAVCLSATPSADCTTLSSAWKDSTGDHTVSCEITEKDSTCPPDSTGIQTVSNCTVN